MGVGGGFASVWSFLVFVAIVFIHGDVSNGTPLLQAVMIGWVFAVFVECVASLCAIVIGATEPVNNIRPSR
jgi:uncharacterized membrane protein YczE